jgi:hypothetical protein
MDEFEGELAEAAQIQSHSRIKAFLDTLPAEDRAEFDEWMKNPTNKAAMWRVLRARGLDVADPTFRAWVLKCR